MFKKQGILKIFIIMGSISPMFSQNLPESVSVPVKVAVYPDRALVTRAAQLHIDKGRQSVKIVRLPFDMNKESMRVSVDSATRVKILSSDLSTNYKLQVPENEIAVLQKQLEALREKKQVLSDRLKSLDNEKKLLESIEVKNIADKNKEIAINKFIADDWSKLLDFYSANSSRIDSAKRDMTRQLTDVQEKMVSLENQIGKNRSRKIGSNELLVTLESDKETEISIKISYLINNASWRPFYEVHTDDGKSIELQYMASIQQNTGEDWNNVKITLTTARPALGIDIAPAEPVVIHRQMGYGYRADKKSSSKAKSEMSRAAMQDSSSAKEAETEESYAEAEPAEYETSQVAQDFASASFQIVKRSNIASDNSSHDVMIVREKLEGIVSYKVIPYANEIVFVSGKIKNAMTYPLLPGKVNLFINNNYIGSASLKNTAPEESFSIPLGPDENIKVKYTKVKQSTETYGLGKKRKKTIYEYRTEIENLKNTTVVLDVNDRIPVSTDADIKVDLKEISPKNENDIEKDRGILLWHLQLKPKEKKIIQFSYTVDHPEDYLISF